MAEAKIQQLGAHVALWISQVQRLNGIADGQAQKIASMADYDQMKHAIIQL